MSLAHGDALVLALGEGDLGGPVFPQLPLGVWVQRDLGGDVLLDRVLVEFLLDLDGDVLLDHVVLGIPQFEGVLGNGVGDVRAGQVEDLVFFVRTCVFGGRMQVNVLFWFQGILGGCCC